MNAPEHRQRLIHILQRAYSGECAAGYAYRGHWRSVRRPLERQRIQQIEREEWVHREAVGRMLDSLGSQPNRWLEVKLWTIGHGIGLACHLIGRFLPMYFAGRLEHGNVDEYDRAAFHADGLGLNAFAAALRHMALVEREHELFFLSVIEGHRLLPAMQAVFKWGSPEPSAPAAVESET